MLVARSKAHDPLFRMVYLTQHCDRVIEKIQHHQVLRPDTKDLVKACHPLTSARALATFNFERVVLGNETFEVTLQQYALARRLDFQQ